MDNPIVACVDRNPFSSMEDLLARVSGAGLAGVEWFEAGPERPWSEPEEAERLRLLVRRYALTAQYHAPYEPPYDLACEGASPRQPGDVAGMILGFLERAERLGARIVTLHLGTHPPEVERAEALRAVMEGILLALPQVERSHIRLALENHTGAPSSSRPWATGRRTSTGSWRMFLPNGWAGPWTSATPT